MQREKNLKKTVCGLLLFLLLTLPAAAAEPAPHVTAQTTLMELRSNPAIQGTGYYTYCWELNHFMAEICQYRRLQDYFQDTEREPAIGALNLIIDNYNAGVKVTWQVYTEEEIAKDDTLGCVQLYYYPSEKPNAKTIIVVPGNALTVTSEMSEGGATAYELHQMGYAVFVLRYRTFLDLGNDGPLKDLARAVQLVTRIGPELNIRTEDYALVGYSSGGQLAGVFANQEHGYGYYGAAKPAALLLGYPIVNLTIMKAVYKITADLDSSGQHYYDLDVDDMVTDDYPPVYFWYGKNDVALSSVGSEVQGSALQKALEAHGVPYRMRVFENAPHSICTGRGTDAEGWLNDAVAFWEAQCP